MIQFTVEHAHQRLRSLVDPRPAPTQPTLDPEPAPEVIPAATEAKKDAAISLASPLAASLPDSRMQLLIAMVEYLSGKKISTYGDGDPAKALEVNSTASSQTLTVESSPDTLNAADTSADDSIANVRIRLQESESLQIHMQGQVTLGDGREMSFAFSESQRRELDIRLQVSFAEAATLIDPLVINLDGPLSLQDKTVAFDLNGDTLKEELSQLDRGSYYLALDHNGNGNIDDGSELFGAISGDGFGELALLDTDGNGLIDASDRHFSQLMLFRPGDGSFTTLSSAGVIALGLENSETPYTFTNDQAKALAQIRSTGFYLRDDGRSGSVQQIDFVV
ncbi:hypothetical protein HBA55_25655 [Pseudomaricurvus alkylphenolicus]|uniref:hypothetical protein n=1 Tax=Pseudomaricurvus alkylphenolicus TaxID=1306991 RepID=UPI001423F0CA|nr:hypothetical protein [Pseudomaricurvus alkylphenolicus]NIB43020.1 hypothetical protein [Pseudomaricurvus alkylphenolicus]